jgi:hypothetical protein
MINVIETFGVRMKTSAQLEAKLLYLNRLNNLLIEFQQICIRMSEQAPDRHWVSYRHIPAVETDVTPIHTEEDLVRRMKVLSSYRLVLQGLPFAPPPLEAKSAGMECLETERIAGGLRKMIGDLTGTWHRGPLWEISGAGMYTELKRKYLLHYLRYFITVAEEWAGKG